MKRTLYDTTQLTEFLHEPLEAELAGERVYGRAVAEAVDYEIREEWAKYLREASSRCSSEPRWLPLARRRLALN